MDLSRRSFLSSTAIVAVGGALASCATPMTPINPAPIINVLQQVLGFLQTTCKIVADSTAILAFIATFPIGTAAEVIASAVCAAVNGTPTASHRRLESVTIDGVTYPAVTMRGISIPYAHIGTALAARLRAAPLRCVYVNGVCIATHPSPF